MDSDNISRLREGDESAFTLIYTQYSGQVYRLAFHFLKDKEQCEEVVQEVFLKLWLNRLKLDKQGNLWLYLYVITKRLCLNALRDIHKSKVLYHNLLIHVSEAKNSTEDEILTADMERYTRAIVEQLPKQQQLIFQLSRAEGLTHQEIAAKLHISPHTVKNHLVEALKKVKRYLRYYDLISCIVLLCYH